eukprot:TRINITY_DN5395_c0_g1_i1.p1 TRINITY_DN5395_c0_g1~~TRINITY_DN5395_c0_g1_i1.p1  ORF type:complete len:112 (-),score=14.95 TRINITY_DN5395_c0_g1_i1:20-355(-)
MDFARLWIRNLGRDDRVIADNGKELRLPFLAEEVLHVVRQLPLDFLCNLREGLGIGDKKLLRDVARKLGLGMCACLQKRALQFGTRIANKKLDGAQKLRDTPVQVVFNLRD